jgi:hypothetical protein
MARFYLIPLNPPAFPYSVEPMGMRIAFEVSRYFWISSQEERWSCISALPGVMN